MNHSFVVGADGPTAVFLAGNLGEGSFPWHSILGLVTLILLFLPNIIARFRRREKNLCENRLMRAAQLLGGLLSIFLMFFWVGPGDWGFPSVGELLVCIFGNLLLILTNWILWIMYYFAGNPRVTAKADGPTAVFVAGKKQVRGIKTLRIAMAAMPVLLFLLDGLTQRYWLLAGSAVVFGVGHIYVTCENMDKRTTKNVQN